MFPCRYGRRNFMNHLPRCGVWLVFCGARAPPLCCLCGRGWGLGFVWWMRVSHAPLLVGVVVFGVVVCGASPRPISTGRLGIAAVHLRPINPVFCWGPYPLEGVGNLILKRASRLDAFSGYHFRT